MICRACNNQNPEEVRFCIFCGAAMTADRPPQSEPLAQKQEGVTTPPAAQEPELFAQAPWLQTPAAPEPYAEGAVPPRKPRNKKKIILSVIAGVTALALVAGLLVFLLVCNTPQYKLAKASERTLEQFREAIGDSEGFVQLLDTLVRIQEEEEYTLELEASSSYRSYNDDYYSDASLSATLHYSLDDEKLLSKINYSTDSSYAESKVELSAYADSDEVQLSLPSRSDEVYVLPLKKLGEELQDAAFYEELSEELSRKERKALALLDIDLFPDVSLDDFAEEYSQTYDDFMNGGLQKSEEKITDTREDLTVYALKPDMRYADELYGKYAVFLTTQYLGEGFADAMDLQAEEVQLLGGMLEEVSLYFGVRDGCLTALELRFADEWSEYGVVLELLGEENLFDEFRISRYENGFLQDEIEGGLKTTKNGFDLTFNDRYEEYTLSVNDRRGCISVAQDNLHTEVLRYGITGEGFWIANADGQGAGYGNASLLRLTVLPLQESPRELDGDTIEVLELDLEELEALGSDLERNTFRQGEAPFY